LHQIAYDVNVNVTLTGPDGSLLTCDLTKNGSVYTSTFHKNNTAKSDEGNYTCSVVLEPKEGSYLLPSNNVRSFLNIIIGKLMIILLMIH